MVNFPKGSMRESGISETGLSHALMLVYAEYGLVAEFPPELALTNCSVPIINKYDSSESKFKYSCLPEHFIINKLLTPEHKEAVYDKKSAVEALFKMIKSDNLNDLLFWMRENKKKSSNIAFAEACFKPFNSKKLAPLPDFGNLTPADQKKSHKDAWLSNIIIKKIITPYCKVFGTVYLGTIYLNFMNSLPEQKRHLAFQNSVINELFPKRIKESGHKQFAAVISMYDHWSALFIDLENKIGYHYNSQGYIPTTQFSNKFKIYSYEKKVVPVVGRTREAPESQVAMVEYLTHVIEALNLNKMYINHEQSQLQDGECGMFSLVFLILLLFNKDSPELVYNTSKFWGDLRHREFRDIFFTADSSFLVVNSKPPIIRDTQTALIKMHNVIKNQGMKNNLIKELLPVTTDLLNTFKQNQQPVSGLDKLMLKSRRKS